MFALAFLLVFHTATLKEYTNLWNLRINTADGRVIEQGTWSDRLEHSKGVWIRTQVSTRRRDGAETRTINRFDAATMLPISSEQLAPDGTYLKRDFSRSSVRSVRVDTAGAVPVASELRIIEPVYDFYGGMYGLLIATMPLRADLEGVIPSIAERRDELKSAHFVVRGRETIRSGGRNWNAWIVDVDDSMKFWLVQEPPYILKLVATGAKGNVFTWEMPDS